MTLDLMISILIYENSILFCMPLLASFLDQQGHCELNSPCGPQNANAGQVTRMTAETFLGEYLPRLHPG